MIIGFSTNGLAHHEPFDALNMLADVGYRSVAINIDHGWLSPRDKDRATQTQKMRHFFEVNQFSNVVEARPRFLLDPAKKYAPTLVDSNPTQAEVRLDFLKYCIDVAVELKSDCVAIRSGPKPEDMSFNVALDQLVKNFSPVLKYAEERKMDIGFEPEPGMLIDSTGRFERLIHLLDSPRLKMTMDIGHLFCLSEVPIANFIEKWQHYLVNVHISDMQAGVHEHLMFGDGQIYFPPVIDSLLSVGYKKGLHIELNRHSHRAAEIAKSAFMFLNPIIEDAVAGRDYRGNN